MNKAKRLQLKSSSHLFRNSFLQENKQTFPSIFTAPEYQPKQQLRLFQRSASQLKYFSTNKPASQIIDNVAAVANTSTSQATSSRDDPAYAWLKNLDEIKKNIGNFVTLPKLPCDQPKDFRDSFAKSFLLTQQRAELLENVILDDSNEEKGLILCGPQGMGKSALAYLIAAYAWVNRLPLVYIVRYELVFCFCVTDFFIYY